MIGTLHNCTIFDGPRTALVVATHAIDPDVPQGSVRVAPLAPDGSGIVPIPQVVPVSITPPSEEDASPTFVPAWPWAAP